MPKLILIVAVVLAFVILIRRTQNLPPHKRKGAYFQIFLGGAVLGVIVLTFMGKMHWVGAALTGVFVVARQALPLLLRFIPALASLRGRSSGPESRKSEVRSMILKMILDHDTGEINGVVLEGPYKDWLLEELDRDGLMELMNYCTSRDADSAQLLSSYLEQRFPGENMEDHDRPGAQDTGSSGLTEKEARSILGVNESATDDEIISAHRSLIQKLHPDRGGNDYLAAKINEAKDYLLDQVI